MSDWALTTPVAFIIFNRPDTTEKVFAEIARARPPRLLIIADGPRAGRPGEAERCMEARSIVDRVDWKCEVSTNYSEINLGCKIRVASGIDWVFEQVPAAIILEDDCLPDPSFFRFCEELLVRYRDDERVSQICGANFQFGHERSDASYYFSRYNHIWGWASWRRAWQHYDREASKWPEFRDSGKLDSLLSLPAERKFWSAKFDSVHQNKLDTWDFQWVLASWARGMLSVIPSVNLISNIGFGQDATHTRRGSPYAALPVKEMKFPLRHPSNASPDAAADDFTARNMFAASMARKALRMVQRLFYREHQPG